MAGPESRRTALESQFGEHARGFPDGKGPHVHPFVDVAVQRGVGHRHVRVGGGHHDRVPAELGEQFGKFEPALHTAAARRRPVVADHEHAFVGLAW